MHFKLDPKSNRTIDPFQDRVDELHVALRDHGGAIVGAISCFYDISEHKRREREQAAIRREMELQASRTVRSERTARTCRSRKARPNATR